jgi:hypothetical protein
MEPRDDGRQTAGDRPDGGPGDVAELLHLEAGVLIPATRRLSKVLAARPPLKIANASATISVIDEQRAERT